jgi:hypothetical protein
MWVIAPGLLLIPLVCMYLGDDRHSGPHHSFFPHPSFQSRIDGLAHGDTMGVKGMTTSKDGKDDG